MYYLGIDVGTGGSRALLADERGKVAHAFTAPHEDMLMHQPLWAEQRPEDWWEATREAIGGVLALASASGAEIGAIGLSGQMHGLVLLDAADAVIRPALIWCDQRSQAQVDTINQLVGRDVVLACTANPMLTGFTLPKLLWVRDHEPANFERIRKLLLPKDYVRFRLTGEYATDVSDASGTGLFDVAERCWSEKLTDLLRIDGSVLPSVAESSCVTAKISAAAAQLTGLRAGTPVVAGAGDQAASAIGNGIVEPGMVSCTLGTSGVVFAYTQAPAYDPPGRVHTFCHAVPAAWHVMGVTQGAGLSLKWFRESLAPATSYDDLTAEAAGAPPGSQGLFWLPYLMGERTPHLDPQVRGGWIGLTASHTRADLIRSLLEGVSYSQCDCLEIIEGMGIPVNSVRVSGGGANSVFWRQMLADMFRKRVVALETQEGSAYGAALLAMIGAGVFGSAVELCRTAIREIESAEPVSFNAQVYAEGHRNYQSLYPALSPFYRSR
jgi:xylulokinase